MLFTKKTWKDRKTEYPNRRALAKGDGSRELVTVSREEGVISEEGDAFSAENMNDLEKRIADSFSRCPESSVIKKIEKVSSLPSDAANHHDTLYIIPG